MRSENSTNNQKTEKRSFIEEARRAQIIEAAIDVIAELGAPQASLAKIANRASISTSLILYHFKDKEALLAAALASIVTDWEAPAKAAIAQQSTASAQLRSYIEARLVYIGTRPKQSIAMINLLFTVRPSDNTQAYRTEERGFELDDIVTILRNGQQNGEFNSFDVSHMAMMIRSTIDQFLGYSQVPDIDLEHYVQDLLGWYGTLIAKKGTL
jgi:TetR/AcrR family transcriptional repressor of bet genes